MTLRTKAAVCHGPGQPLQLETLTLKAPGPGEVLIEIKATGLCHSDLHQITGKSAPYPYPIVLGHEGAGVVAECGAGVTSVKPGDHVVPLSIAECGRCSNCRSGKTNLCEQFFPTIGSSTSNFLLHGKPLAAYAGLGTFSNYLVVKEVNVARIREDVPFDIACYMGCGVATGLGAVLHTARMEPGASVAVIGLGSVGLNVVQAARLAGAAQIIGIDTNAERELTARQFGATDFINPINLKAAELVGLVTELSGGGVDYSFECVGSVELVRQALNCTRAGWGTCVVVGMLPDGEEIRVDAFNLLLGRNLKGSFLGNVKTRSQLPDLLDLYMDKRINLDQLITHRLPLEKINEGFAMMAQGNCIRSIVMF